MYINLSCSRAYFLIYVVCCVLCVCVVLCCVNACCVYVDHCNRGAFLCVAEHRIELESFIYLSRARVCERERAWDPCFGHRARIYVVVGLFCFFH